MKLSKLGLFKNNNEEKSEPIQENTDAQVNNEEKSEPVQENTNAQSNEEKKSELFQENTEIQKNKVIHLNKISCTSCGAPVDIEEGQVLVTCPFCRNQFKVIEESPDFSIDRGVLLKYSGENREVNVPHGVTAIGILAFSQQSTLTKIILPEGVTELQGLFFNCTNLEKIILPESLENIPNNTFSGCVSLKSIDLPKNLKFLGEMAFHNCKSLTSIEIPPKVEYLETLAFMDCDNLKTISYYDQTKIKGEYFVGCHNLISLNMLDSETNEIISKKKIIDHGNNHIYGIEK
ncbi:MAG: leucine-rich repeat protein [Methanobacteriaceae archaeon]|jgi:RNA polymerase-binding transcription factor DksA|nr:leucine-rich repeat protein [Candidatus Methanorudis spinitermitis]